VFETGTDIAPGYFLMFFLSCFGFLTSFLRTLFPFPITNSFLTLSADNTGSRARKRSADSFYNE
jgi:hypothetical protein